jgi:hypothetical protein
VPEGKESEPWDIKLLMEKPQVSTSTSVLTQVVSTWVHIGDITDLLQDDAKIMGTIQGEQWGGPVTVGQQANLGWGETQSLKQ